MCADCVQLLLFLGTLYVSDSSHTAVQCIVRTEEEALGGGGGEGARADTTDTATISLPRQRAAYTVPTNT